MTVQLHSTHERAAHDPAHGSMKSYVIGFILSLVLTVLSFGVIMSGLVPHDMMLPAIVILALAQLFVQLGYFLHMGTGPTQRNNTAIFAFTGLIIVIVIAGSLWVMHNANENMMPTSMTPDSAMHRD